MAKKFILQFTTPIDSGPDAPERVHIAVAYVWQEGPDDMHIQFDGPGKDNFYPKYERGYYHVKLKGKVLKYDHMCLLGELGREKSVRLNKTEMESFWVSPNRH